MFNQLFLAGFFISSLIVGSVHAVFIQCDDDPINPNAKIVTLRFGNAIVANLANQGNRRKVKIETIGSATDTEIGFDNNQKISTINFQYLTKENQLNKVNTCIKYLKGMKRFQNNTNVNFTNHDINIVTAQIQMDITNTIRNPT